MSETLQRVACPACGARFKTAVDSVPEGVDGLTARCRRCGHAFRVLRRGTVLTVATTQGGGRPSATPLATGPTPLPTGAFSPGDRVGRYEVETVLGRGGMGTVYKAYDPAANRHVALKVLSRDAGELDRLRFQREIELQGNIQHPNIMPIFDSGSAGPQRWYVMELLKDPVDLLEITKMARTGALAKDARLRSLSRLEGLIEKLILPLCRAVHHANTVEGVLHRDIKPANVLVERSSLRPLLIDFGVSTILEKRNVRLDHLARELPIPLKGEGIRVTGTLVFMPPEQAKGEADRRGDVWGLGALLHYLVAGEPPLEQALRPTVSRAERIEGLQMLIDMARADDRLEEVREFEATLAEVERGTERSIEDLMRDVRAGNYLPRPPGLSRTFDAIINRAMTADVEKRYRHAMELHGDLEAWLDSRPTRARIQREGRAGGLWYRTRLYLKRHRAAWVLGLLGVGVGLGLMALRGGDDVDPSQVAQGLVAEADAAIAKGSRAEAVALLTRALEGAPKTPGILDRLDRLREDAQFEEDLRMTRDLHAGLQRLLAQEEPDAEALARARGALDAMLSQRMAERRIPVWLDGAAITEELARFHARAAGTREVRFVPPTLLAGCDVAVFPAQPTTGVAWDAPVPGPEGGAGAGRPWELRAGRYVVRIRRDGRALFLPLEVRWAATPAEVRIPIAPEAQPPGMRFVPGGEVRGPFGTVRVKSLYWDETEVTNARYAAFIASLPADEQRRRAPRASDVLGGPGRSYWERNASGVLAPDPSTASLPVDSISPEDAAAFAAFEGKRLPTTGEWARAAVGDSGFVTPLGAMGRIGADTAHIDADKDGALSVRTRVSDRSPYGLFDMAGNVAEITGTIERWRGRTGWLVMGGSYDASPGAALVTEAQLMPGWVPRAGVGFRCVKDVE